MKSMEKDTQVLHKMQKDIELIKNILLAEKELTPWAKKELKKAREKGESNYTDLDDL